MTTTTHTAMVEFAKQATYYITKLNDESEFSRSGIYDDTLTKIN